MYRVIAFLVIVTVAIDHFALHGFYRDSLAASIQQLGVETSSEVNRMFGR